MSNRCTLNGAQKNSIISKCQKTGEFVADHENCRPESIP